MTLAAAPSDETEAPPPPPPRTARPEVHHQDIKQLQLKGMQPMQITRVGKRSNAIQMVSRIARPNRDTSKHSGLICPLIYFVQGVLDLSRLAVSFYLKDDLHLDPAETAVISGFSALPWLVKPLYRFISDSIPLFGYRRRSYLILSGLLGALSWSLMATIVDDKYNVALSIVLGSLAVAVSDVQSINKCCYLEQKQSGKMGRQKLRLR